MKRILAFSGSMSGESINHSLIEFTQKLITEHEVETIRLSDYEAPLYAKELEAKSGIPAPIQELRKKFDKADAFILSTPEYNSSIPGGLKNTLDWISRMEGKIFQDKPLLLMATSPGGRGGKGVLDHLSAVLPYWGANLVGTFSLPSFNSNLENGEMNGDFQSDLEGKIKLFKDQLL